MATRSYGQYCGVSTAAELVAERWALLILRDLLVGPRRYTDLKQGLPKIPTNILSNRLKELESHGVIRRAASTGGSVAYECTEYGQQLEPMMLALGRWGFQKMGHPSPDDVVTPDSITMALRTAFKPETAAQFPPTTYDLHMEDIALRIDVDGGSLTVRQMAPTPPPVARHTLSEEETAQEADLLIMAGPQLRELISGSLTPATAVETEAVKIRGGDQRLLERFAATFHIASSAPI